MLAGTGEDSLRLETLVLNLLRPSKKSSGVVGKTIADSPLLTLP
jgi:hypothetical protein